MEKIKRKIRESEDDYIETDDEIDSDIDAQIKALQDKREQRKKDAKRRRDEIETKKRQEVEENKEALDFYNKNKEKIEEIKKISNIKDKHEKLFDLLVSSSGSSLTEAGEIVRAVNKLIYRYLNDGDVFFEEDAGGAENAAAYLSKKIPGLYELFKNMTDSADDYFEIGNIYERDLWVIVKYIYNYLFSNEKLFQKKNRESYLDFDAIEWELPLLDASIILPEEVADAYHKNIIREEDIEDWIIEDIGISYLDNKDVQIDVNTNYNTVDIYNVPYKYKSNLHEFEKNSNKYLINDLEMFKEDNNIVEKYNKPRSRRVTKESYLKEEPSGSYWSEYNIATSPNGVKVNAQGSYRENRRYSYESVSLRISGLGFGEGEYRWENRDWQKFSYANALYDAGEDVGLPKELLDKAENESHDLDTWVEYIAGHIDEYLQGGVKEEYSLRKNWHR